MSLIDLDRAVEIFSAASDLTVGLEEEFSILDPQTLDLAPRFEHRLFLSATPHNGHSNSFSTLLELLDAQRAFNDTMQSYLDAQASLRRAASRLNAAVGFAIEEPLAVPPICAWLCEAGALEAIE